ncbi:MAG TPA: GAF domain-containing protein [Candidatus Acidoferrales bacterium]|nr:GAF domain-containing protein [Candidatus Acidoferrales bacterium]HTX56425.1 GAF domain-containing protein [Candidatus Acidoferrales bacterium]
MKAFLLSLCGIGAAVILFFAADAFGAGGPPWYGWWDSTTAFSETPFTLITTGVVRSGASDKAGIHAGDLVDLRDQSLDGRFARVYQPFATRPVELVVRRNGRRIVLHLLGSSTLEGNRAIKISSKALPLAAAIWFFGCALLIVLRRADKPDARVIATVLLLQIGFLLKPGNFAIPSAPWAIALGLLSAASLAISAALLLRLTSRYAAPSTLVRAVSTLGYMLISAEFLRVALGFLGLTTLWFDPIPYLAPNVQARGAYATAWDLIAALQWLAIATVAILATRAAPRSERSRTTWLLLPLPFAFFVQGLVMSIEGLTSPWVIFTVLVVTSNIFWLLGGLVVTYAILKRRVLDLEFVIGRTLVVGIVSLIVVASFILLEWILGNVLAGASHATGIVAGGALALGLGLSMRYIHERVDRAVDILFFRKRHEDERSLRDFSKEAAFVTDIDALLDRAMWNVREHTDARRSAFLLLDGSGYAPARVSGDGVMTSLDENDGVVLALKTWHKPLDPHHYDSQLHAVLALPMLARGQLLGILILGERAGGEAYAPDEIDALAQLAHGVASALDGLQSYRNGAALRESLNASIETLGRKIDHLNAKLS